MPVGRKKGTPKTGGRQKGTPNKVSSEKRKLLDDFIFGDWDKFKEDFEKLDFKEKIDYKIKMMPYVVARLQSTENKINLDFDNMTDEQINRLFDIAIKENQ